MVATEETIKGLVLYGTSACHLCEIAREMLEYHRKITAEIHYSCCDVSESDELFQRYGLKIPVVRRADGLELDWPFSLQELGRFLG